MPPRILSEAELARFERWPAHVPSAELVRSFTLTGPDCDLIAVRRRPANRLGIAMQRVLTRFVLKYTLTAQPEPSGAHEL